MVHIFIVEIKFARFTQLVYHFEQCTRQIHISQYLKGSSHEVLKVKISILTLHLQVSSWW
jgi:hypothetical protein